MVDKCDIPKYNPEIFINLIGKINENRYKQASISF